MFADPLDAPSLASRERMGYNPERIEEHYHFIFSLVILWTSPCSSLCVGLGNQKVNNREFIFIFV